MTNSSTRSQSEKPKKKMKSIFCNRHSDTAFRLLVICLVVIGLIIVNNGGRATAARDFSPPRTGKVPILAAAEPSL